MDVAVVLREGPHAQLHVIAELVANEDILRIASERPRVVLGTVEVEFIKGILRSVIAKENGVFQFSIAIFAAEENAPAMLGIGGVAGIAAPDADATMGMEPVVDGVRVIKHFDGSLPLPFESILAGVDIDTRGGIRQCGDGQSQADAREGHE